MVPVKNSGNPFFVSQSSLILASASPRRQRFLADLGLDFQTIVPDIPEESQPGENPEAFVRRISQEKACSIGEHHPDSWILAADTIVVLAGEILGKPRDPVHAIEMLTQLNGKRHEVWTGFCVYRGKKKRTVCRSVKTTVYFLEASQQMLKSYVATSEPLDKAGAYGIQGKGGVLVERIEGSYSNVVGLPLSQVVRELLALKIIAPSTGNL